MTALEKLVRDHIRIPARSSPSGFYTVVCKICHDHGRKGPRGGFRFELESVGYHCFNCSFSTGAKEGYKIPKKMVQVLEAFGVPKIDILSLNIDSFEKIFQKKTDTPALNLDPAVIELPKSFNRLHPQNEDKQTLIAIYYLQNRGIAPEQYPFYLSAEGIWRKRIIIPIYNRQGELIFYQGRAMFKSTKRRYASPNVIKKNILYGFRHLFSNDELPLFITEGFFDAFHLDGVALLGKELSKEQAIWINKSSRQKIYIPDRTGGGLDGAKAALRQGWSLSTPDIGSCNDISEAISRYGKIYVISSIMQSISSGDEAKLLLSLYCK